MTCQRIDGSDSSSHSVTSMRAMVPDAADMRHPLTPAASAPRRLRFRNATRAAAASACLDVRMSDANVTTYLLDRLAEAGVDRLFGVPGDFTLAMLDDVEGHRVDRVGRLRQRARRRVRGRRVRTHARARGRVHDVRRRRAQRHQRHRRRLRRARAGRAHRGLARDRDAGGGPSDPPHPGRRGLRALRADDRRGHLRAGRAHRRERRGRDRPRPPRDPHRVPTRLPAHPGGCREGAAGGSGLRRSRSTRRRPTRRRSRNCAARCRPSWRMPRRSPCSPASSCIAWAQRTRCRRCSCSACRTPCRCGAAA